MADWQRSGSCFVRKTAAKLSAESRDWPITAPWLVNKRGVISKHGRVAIDQ